MIGWLKIAKRALWTAIAATCSLFAFSAWAIAPYPFALWVLPETASHLLHAPFASRIVIGDSRVAWGKPTGDALFAGYGSATTRHLERVTRVLCALSDAPVTIALGINDAKPDELDLAATRASLEEMVGACGPAQVRVAQIWPNDPNVPGGADYDSAALAQINADIAGLSNRAGLSVMPVPPLEDFTIDGVHFTPEVSARYMAALAAPD